MSKKAVISAIILLTLTILSFFTFQMSSNMTKEVKKSQEASKIGEEKVNIDDLIITETKEGKKYWEIYATSGTYANSQGVVNLKEVIGNFYKDNKVVMSFVAPIGTYDSRNKGVSLQGGSNVATDSDVKITAEKISWAGNNDEIHAQKNVVINKKNDLITNSNEAIFSSDFSKFKIIGKAKTNVYKKGL